MAMDLFLLFSTPLIILSLTIIIFKINGRINTKSIKLPPGTMGLPFIGHTIPFMQPHSSSSLGLFINQSITKHGRIFKMSFLGKPTIVSADADFNRYILQSEGRMFENSCPTSIAEILGRWSMLALEGKIHKEMRSIAVNFMSNAKLRTYFLPDIEQQALNILNSWKDGSTFSAHIEGKKFAFNLMVKHLMSMNPGLPETEKLRKEYHTFMKGMASMPLNLPSLLIEKHFRSVILKIMGRCFDERVKKIREGCNGLEKDDLLASVSLENNLTGDQILDLILSMLFAGHETSSTAICLAIYFLESSPKALQQLREEHENISRMKSESWLTWEDYKEMEFTQCVINETLRLGNIVKFLHRKAIQDVQYKGYDIPCGWEVIPIISAAHLDSNIYDDPQNYNPWRWQNTTMAKSKNNSIMSFSGGPRMCPGAELSKMEMAVFLHHLVLKFNWELAEHDYPVSFPFLGFPKNLPIKVHAIKKN
ncbi:putative cytochrome P450 [Dioscorea sansibarensis]